MARRFAAQSPRKFNMFVCLQFNTFKKHPQ